MKKLLFITVASLAFTGCKEKREERKFIVISKTFKQAGMCHDESRKELYKSIVYIPVVMPHVAARHHHTYEAPSYKMNIVNDNGSECLNVDSATYSSFDVLDIVTYDGVSIGLIRHYGKSI